MNINMTVECETCSAHIACRVGMSNRYIQPIRFCCQSCGSPIDMTFHGMEPTEFTGAKPVDDATPFEQMPFVDLHLDFPVTFDPYVMGMTPYMKAVQRVGLQEMQVHQARLNQLNASDADFRLFKLLLKLYKNEKLKPFKLSAGRNFAVVVKSSKPEDINVALYVIIAKMMWPFAMPGDNGRSVDQITVTLIEQGEKQPEVMKAFIHELVETKFLKNLQIDCLDIYPRIVDSEVALRPALFLDFDTAYHDNPVPMRVSHAAFEDFKDLYKDISEIISKQMVLLAGMNNIIKRGDHNKFLPGIGKVGDKDRTPKNLHAFADVPFGYKVALIDDV